MVGGDTFSRLLSFHSIAECSVIVEVKRFPHSYDGSARKDAHHMKPEVVDVR